MSRTTEDIVKCFNQLRDFCREVSTLLATADTLVGDKGWISACGSRAVADRSDASYYPLKWIPAAFARLYVNNDRPNILAFVTVIVGGYEEKEKISEALVSGGWLEYAPGTVIGNDWYWWYTRWHSWIIDRQDNGKLYPRVVTKPKQAPGVLKVTTFAYPLDVITSGEVFKEIIVDRLLIEIDNVESPT